MSDPQPDGNSKPPITLREAASLLQAVGFALAGAASMTREVRRAAEGYRHRRRTMRRPRTITLYRPVGEGERALIEQSGFREFPPRLTHQPIFYPVLNEGYATQIARDWNTRDAASGYTGFVTRFQVRADFLAHYAVQTVGASEHQEYWIPAGDLAQFNSQIVGTIEIIAEFYGERKGENI